MNSRERAVQASRRVLSDEQLVSFLRHIRNDGNTLAVRLINEDLDEGQNLDSIFYTGDEFGFALAVRAISKSEFDVSFGCQAGELAGDGGQWKVTFDGDVIRSIEASNFWIS